MFSTSAVNEDAVEMHFVIYGIIHVMALLSPLLPSQWRLKTDLEELHVEFLSAQALSLQTTSIECLS